MNWGRVLIAGVVAGIVVNLVDFVLHGMIMSSTYTEYSVFTQEQANPLWFFVIAILIGIFATALFAKTRDCWAEGIKGGLTYGFFLGLVFFFQPFYNPLVLEGFPYYLSWCWGGINMIDALVFGLVIGGLYKGSGG